MSTCRSHRWRALVGPFLTIAVLVLGGRQGAAAESPQTKTGLTGVGLAKETAIEVCGPNGEHGYFDRLLCPDGSSVNYEQIGNEGTRNVAASRADQEAARIQALISAPIPSGQKDFHRVDRYSVECSAGPVSLYVDRYHCPEPKNQGAPPGFSFIKSRSPESLQTDSGQVGLGLAKQTAIEVCGPTGGRDYLDRLRCPDGSVVRSQRTGSMGLRNEPTSSVEDAAARQQWMNLAPIPSGQRDFHLIDAYSAECPGQKRSLYLDPYHCPDPKYQSPPPGFSLAGGKKSR